MNPVDTAQENICSPNQFTIAAASRGTDLVLTSPHNSITPWESFYSHSNLQLQVSGERQNESSSDFNSA
jgi:hypothetical protein